MANLKASEKDILRTKRNREQNLRVLSTARTEIKKFLKILLSATQDEVQKQLTKVNSVCSIATKKNVFHKNKTARIVSRLTHKFKAKFDLYKQS